MQLRNLKGTLFILVLCLSVSVSSAQLKDGVNSVLWKVQYPNSPHKSYLLGTFHYFGAEWVNSFPVLDTLLTASSTFISEIRTRDPLFKKQLSDALANDHDKRTTKELFGENFDLVNNYFLKNNNQSITEWDTLEAPKVKILGACSGYLTILFGEKSNLKLHKRDGSSMDNVLEKKSEAYGKEIMGLDNVANLKASLTSEKFNEALVTSIVEYIKMINSINSNGTQSAVGVEVFNLIKMYENGMWKYKFKDNYPSVMNDALKKRNKDWMKQLPNSIKNKDCFIAVGAEHLNYKKGLITELTKKGFILTPIKLKN
jgi:uncharacterized protein YbaP (TraB family)